MKRDDLLFWRTIQKSLNAIRASKKTQGSREVVIAALDKLARKARFSAHDALHKLHHLRVRGGA